MSEATPKTTPANPIFGPVPSRRLGMSLGVDVIPMKVCAYDCIYCEVGRTTKKTIVRAEYVPTLLIENALEQYFADHPAAHLDYVTFAGSGEPTLHAHLGALIRKVKALTTTPVAVLTGGALLADPQVRRELSAADLVIPSLDAATQDVFAKVNRPVASLQVAKVIEGIESFCREFQGETWLEILIVKGINDHPAHVAELVAAVNKIQPTKIQLTTVVRPPGAGHAEPIDAATLNEIAALFSGDVEVVAAMARRDNPAYQEAKGEQIISMLKIRPMTLDDLASSTGMHRNEVLKYLDQLRLDHAVHEAEFDQQTYFTVDRLQKK